MTDNEKRVARKRRQRARLYAMGLNSLGRPATPQSIRQRIYVEHPPECPCYDCLWGGPDNRQRIAARVAVMS